MDNGQWTMDNSMDNGQWTMDNEMQADWWSGIELPLTQLKLQSFEGTEET
ncbi:MAG: hypothetical protein FWF88_01870 [Peptococcaceae bacterium]|nr:hypothetical protein [Peptococcaceae bacterium]